MLFFRRGFEDFVLSGLNGYFSAVFQPDRREASLTAGQDPFEILKMYFHRLASIVFKSHV